MSTVAASTATAHFPRWALALAGALLLLVLVAVGALRLAGWSPVVQPGAVVTERTLQFTDTADGGVLVRDGASGQTVAELRGEQGFVRGVLRGMARERRLQQAAGVTTAYTLSLHDDGRLVLSDPITRQRIDLASFGVDNAAVFLRWLPLPPPAAKALP